MSPEFQPQDKASKVGKWRQGGVNYDKHQMEFARMQVIGLGNLEPDRIREQKGGHGTNPNRKPETRWIESENSCTKYMTLADKGLTRL